MDKFLLKNSFQRKKLFHKFRFNIILNYLFVLLLAVLFTINLYLYFFYPKIEPIQLKLLQRSLYINEENWRSIKNGLNESNDQWKPIGDPSKRFKIFSAYFDARLEIVENYSKLRDRFPFGSVRILTILPMNINKKSVSCNLKYRDFTVRTPTFQVNFIRENFGMPFSATFVVCLLTQNMNEQEVELPIEVGLTYDCEPSMRNVTSFVKIRYPEFLHNSLMLPKQTDNLSICVGPVHHNFDNALRIVEFVEMYKLLDVTRFFFYNCSISKDTNRVFEFYQKQGIVEILSWNLTGYKFEEDLRYAGIFAAINDCIYRSAIVHNFKYTAIVDFDEILMPFSSPSLLQFVTTKDNDQINSFNFQNVFFFKLFDADFSNVPSDIVNNYLYSQVQIVRTAEPLAHHTRSKYIVKGRTIVEVGNHQVYDTLHGTAEYKVESDEGLLFHYRDECARDYCGKTTLTDLRARYYGDQLWSNVEKVCHTLFADGICPMMWIS